MESFRFKIFLFCYGWKWLSGLVVKTHAECDIRKLPRNFGNLAAKFLRRFIHFMRVYQSSVSPEDGL